VTIPILTDLVIIFGLSLLVLFVCHQFRIPVTVGFIFTGILAGPHVFALVPAVDQGEILAEIGVILLLFTIGVEFSFANLLQIRQSVLVAGPVQVVATGGAGLLLGRLLGESFHNPDPDVLLLAGNLLITMGSPLQLGKVAGLFAHIPGVKPQEE